MAMVGIITQECSPAALTRDLSNSDSILGGSREVHMIGANTSSQRQLEVLGLLHAVWREVARVEGCCDPALRTAPFRTTWPQGMEAHGKVPNADCAGLLHALLDML